MDAYAYIIVISVIVLALFYAWKNFTVVPPDQAHVISGGAKPKIYDGHGRYILLPFWQTRNVLSKAVIEISVPSIRLHDKDYLPFAVNVSCKVSIQDPLKAAETLGNATAAEIRPIVDDTIQSAARSQAMLHDLVTIMRERDTIEESIYTSTTASLSRVGIRVTLFDIKDIVDVNQSTVIADMERVRSSEINKNARIAEAQQRSSAEIYEADRQSEAEISKQEAFRKSEEARYRQEQFIADQRKELTLREMEVLEADTQRKQEIEKERVRIAAEAEVTKQTLEAQARAEAQLIEAKANSEAIKLQAEAEATTIRMKLEAEAEGTEKLAVALKKLDGTGMAVKIAEIYAEAQKVVSENMARGIQANSKLFLPMQSNGGNPLMSLIPTIEAMKEAGTTIGDALKKSEE
ncbi:MAG: hypothetical protein INQ03_09905 [Candidatus Heimdallarchaeota archaeon]|nr:hypothetical protein [Candidatus Heimdallarchaeota archaeon]